MISNCGAGEDSWQSLGLQGDPPVHSKGDQPWVFFGRNDAVAETPVLWPPHVKSWLIGKDSDAGRDWGQEEKGTTEDEMAGWHHWLDGREFEWILGVDDGQGGLACWIHGVAKSWTRLSNWNELKWWLVMLSIFLCFCLPSVCLLWKISIKVPCLFLKLRLCFSCWIAWVLYIFWNQPLIKYIICIH